jgi:NAD(P)-dependent dehydrogenase (short-subunit alcohol dehydrogenase family)
MSTDKKVLVVTGTTSGMGRVIALDAAAVGYAVVATGRDHGADGPTGEGRRRAGRRTGHPLP